MYFNVCFQCKWLKDIFTTHLRRNRHPSSSRFYYLCSIFFNSSL